jgi:hypothetical protein
VSAISFVDKVSARIRDDRYWFASRDLPSEKGGLPYSAVHACFLKKRFPGLCAFAGTFSKNVLHVDLGLVFNKQGGGIREPQKHILCLAARRAS